MRLRSVAAVAAGALALISVSASAQTAPFQEWDKWIKNAQEIAPLTSELFGDSVSLYNGSTEFAVTDIDLPGNNALPVRLARRFVVTPSIMDQQILGGFGSWDIDVPYISATSFDSWNYPNGKRCSQFSYPLPYNGFEARDYWVSPRIHMPGQGDEEVLRADTWDSRTKMPADGHTYLLATKSFGRLRCTNETKNDYPGEGFILLDANGTTYTFDVGFQRNAGKMSKQVAEGVINDLHRQTVYLMVSRVEDRYGNTVDYNWVGGELRSIVASDGGRSITLEWDGGNIKKAWTTADRVWTYTYGPGPFKVTLPDESFWSYDQNFTQFLVDYHPVDWATDGPNCAPALPANHSRTLTATHPSGATGVFAFKHWRHHRSGIPESACQAYLFQSENNYRDHYEMMIPDFSDVMTILSKSISGPGMSTMNWIYGYGEVEAVRTPQMVGEFYPCTNCQETKSNIVEQPDGTLKEYVFGVVWNKNDGRLIAQYDRKADGKIVRASTNLYLTNSEAENAPFPDRYGFSFGGDDATNTRIRPIRSTTIQQGGLIPGAGQPDTGDSWTPDSFSLTNQSFDLFGRPISVVKSSSLGFSKTDTATFYDHFGTWALGQTLNAATDGIETLRIDYDALARPWKIYRFGLLKETLTYTQGGALQTVTPGRTTHTTTLGSWKRGVPRSIVYPDTTSESAVVNDHGWIDSVTPRIGAPGAMSYAYDFMGRLKTITYPTGDTTAWAPTNVVFQVNASTPYGLPAGHWVHSTTTGNGRTATYYSVLWQPLLTVTEDLTNVNTRSLVVYRYDSTGRRTFVSYPVSSLVSVNDDLKGTTTKYDNLGRVAQVLQDSELGVLTTTTEYLSGFRTKVTNPRTFATTTSYQAYESPIMDFPVRIEAPLEVLTTITRDAFGKPLSITRSGPEASP